MPPRGLILNKRLRTNRWAVHVTSSGLIHKHAAKRERFTTETRRLRERKRMLRVFKLRSTASEIPATLSGVNQRALQRSSAPGGVIGNSFKGWLQETVAEFLARVLPNENAATFSSWNISPLRLRLSVVNLFRPEATCALAGLSQVPATWHRRTSNRAIAAATAALSEPTRPRMGNRITASQVSRINLPSPSSSLPTTTPIGPVRSASS